MPSSTSRRQSLSRPLAALMRTAGHELLSDADYVVPVPLHPTRRWSRGFNQAAALARHLGPPVRDPLRRTRPTLPQATLTSSHRRHNVEGAFARFDAGLARASRRGASGGVSSS